MKQLRWLIVALTFGFCVQTAGASDFAVWPEAGIKVKRDNKMFKGDVQVRFRDNASDFHNYRVELGPGAGAVAQN